MKHALDFIRHLEKFVELKVKDMSSNDVGTYEELLTEKEEFIRFLNKMYFKTKDQ
jgi:hypothetical protein